MILNTFTKWKTKIKNNDIPVEASFVSYKRLCKEMPKSRKSACQLLAGQVRRGVEQWSPHDLWDTWSTIKGYLPTRPKKLLLPLYSLLWSIVLSRHTRRRNRTTSKKIKEFKTNTDLPALNTHRKKEEKTGSLVLSQLKLKTLKVSCSTINVRVDGIWYLSTSQCVAARSNNLTSADLCWLWAQTRYAGSTFYLATRARANT